MCNYILIYSEKDDEIDVAIPDYVREAFELSVKQSQNIIFCKALFNNFNKQIYTKSTDYNYSVFIIPSTSSNIY